MSEDLTRVYDRANARRAAEAEAELERQAKDARAALLRERIQYALRLRAHVLDDTHPKVLHAAAEEGEATHLRVHTDLGRHLFYDWDKREWDQELPTADANETRYRLELGRLAALRRAKELRDEGHDAHAVKVHHPEHLNITGVITPATDSRTATTIPAHDEYDIRVDWGPRSEPPNNEQRID